MSNVREHWSSRVGFILAAVGSAVGLGILWKFPYTVGKNGGGLFLLAYIVFVLIIGVPVFIAELMIGRKTQAAAVGAFASLAGNDRGWKVVGWFGVLSSFLIMAFYSVIAGWGMSYVLMSLTGFYHNLSQKGVETIFHTLSHSGSITVFWHLLFTLITMGIVLSGVRKGIEFWSRIMTRALFVMLLVLFAYSATLPGFSQAAEFIFYPDVSRFQLSSMLEALGLAFFTLSLGQGIMISYGSYMRQSSDIPSMAAVVAGSVIVVALLAAMTIFPVVFTFHLSPAAGSGLVFQTLPYLFAQMPGALVLSTAFFALFVFTALTSSIPFIEVVATNLMELRGWSRRRATLAAAGGTFLFGIPCALSNGDGLFGDWVRIYGQTFIETIEGLVFVWLVPIGGLLTSLFVGWVINKEVSFEEFSEGDTKRFLWKMWYFSLRWVIPLFVLLIIVQKSGLFDFDTLWR